MTAVDDRPTPTPAPGPDRWEAVCRLTDLVPERGAAALVGGEQVALVRLHDDRVLAVDQRDPYSGAHVLSRGIVGSRGDAPTIASPLHKQVFDLRTGECLEPMGHEPHAVRTWPVRVEGGVVLVAPPGAPGGAAGGAVR
jgi:NAD(P)H-dependent nitrite reductase small subunit